MGELEQAKLTQLFSQHLTMSVHFLLFSRMDKLKGMGDQICQKCANGEEFNDASWMGHAVSHGFSMLSQLHIAFVFLWEFILKWGFFAVSPMSESVFLNWLLLFNFRAVVSKDIYKHQIKAES